MSGVMFLDSMTAVLKEQRRDQVPPAGLRILQAIEVECGRVEKTASTFLQRNIVIKFNNASSTVAALRDSRVTLHEHWTLYLVSLSAAGSAPAPTSRLGTARLQDSHSTPPLSAHLSLFSRVVAAINSGSADGRAAQEHLRALSCQPPGDLTDAQERELAVAVAHVEAAVVVPAAAFESAAAELHARLAAMRGAMATSVAAGFAELKGQLEAIYEQNAGIALDTQAVLAEVKGVREVFDAFAFGVTAPIPPEHRAMADSFAAAVSQEERCVFDQNLMACPATGVRFAADGDAAPTIVPGCHCTVSLAVAEKYREDEQCGVCKQSVPEDGELKPDRVALNFLQDLAENRLPAIRKFDADRDFAEDGEHGTRRGSEGLVRFGTLRGAPAAVKTVEFAAAGASAQQWRCRRHVLLNSICTQHRAARASQHVCDVVGLCWGERCAHIAMPRYELTLGEHVERNAPKGMPVHRVLELCYALTRAVHDVHACGILHCDINPENVLLAEDGTPRLIDFGLSHIDRDGLKTRTTIGYTMQYAPPEQLAGHVNKASDIYALGRTLAFAATGVKPLHHKQKMPKEPPELKQQLQAMTGTEEQRKALRLLQVIDEFAALVKQHGRMPIDNVHTTDDLASQLAFGDVVDLSRRDLAIADGDPASRPGVRATANKEVVSDHLHITTWVLCASPDATCWDLAQGGATLRAATLLLPPNGQLHVLNADAAGGWDNVTVKGGEHSTVVVHGAMALNSVTFDGCTLVATEAADLTLSNCTFRDCCVAALGTGASTALRFTGCSVRDCQTGVVVTSGARATLDEACGVACRGRGCCVVAQGEGASASVTGAALDYGADGPVTRLWRACVAVLHGGAAQLERARMAGTGFAGGVLSFGEGSKATVAQCVMTVSTFSVWAAHKGAADVRGGTITGGNRGIFSTDAGSRVEAAECAVSGCSDNCVDVRFGGRAVLTECSVSSSTRHNGVSVHGAGSEAVMTGGTVCDNAECGILVVMGAALIATACIVEKNKWDGVGTCYGATATLHRCKLVSSVNGGGIYVSGAASTVEVNHCEFSRNALHGARAHDGGVLRAAGCTASENGSREEYRGMTTGAFASGPSPPAESRQGAADSDNVYSSTSGPMRHYPGGDPRACGFYSRSPGSRIILQGNCTATVNCAGGFVAAHGARIEASDSRAAENGGPGGAVRRGASASFTRCEFTQSKAAAGVEVCDVGTAAEVVECKATGNAGAGMCVQDGASLSDKESHATGNAAAGLYLNGVGSKVTADGLRVHGNHGSGVVVQQRAELQATECDIRENAVTGLHVHACGNATMRRSWVVGTREGSGVVVTDSDSKVTLVSCRVAKNKLHGVLVQDAAQLEVWGSVAPSCVEKNTMSNVRVEGRGSARMQNCYLKSSVERSGLNVDGRGSCAKLKDCTLSHNMLCGLIAQNDARVEGERLTVEKNAQAGVCVQTGATADLRRVSAANCREGSGILVHGEGASVQIADSRAEGNAVAGVDVQEGGKVVAERITTLENARAGVSVDRGSTAELCKCHSTDAMPYDVPKPKGKGCMNRRECTPP